MARGILALVFACFLLAAGSARAEGIVVDATGDDSATDQTFWGIAFESGAGFIESFTIDITEAGTFTSDAFFDFDGGLFGNDPTGPVFTQLNGLTESDISVEVDAFVSGNSDHPAILTLNFAEGSFGAGDSLRFFADTDFLLADPLPASLIGQAGVQVRVKLFDMPEMAGVFETTDGGSGDGGQSAANFAPPAAVPLPAAAWLFLSAIGMLLGWRGLRPKAS